MRFTLPLFREGDEVYLHIEDCVCLVTITEVYRYKGMNCYSVDASAYSDGLELEYVVERVLTKKVSQKSKGYISSEHMDKIIEEFNGNY